MTITAIFTRCESDTVTVLRDIGQITGFVDAHAILEKMYCNVLAIIVFYDKLIISYQSIEKHAWAEILLFNKKKSNPKITQTGRKFVKKMNNK